MWRGYVLASLFMIVCPVARTQAEDKYYCALCVGPQKDTEMRAIFFKVSDDLASTTEADEFTVRPIADEKGATRRGLAASLDDGSLLSGPYRIDKELFERAIKAPGEMPDATNLITLHNLEPWFVPPGQAPDLIRERFQLAASRIIPRAGK